jgi:phytoene dehydrogenase-like protein
VTGVALADGEVATDVVVTAVHPRSASSATSTPASCRTTSWPPSAAGAAGAAPWSTSLSELPDFASHPGTHLQPHHTGAIELAHSLDYLEAAFQDARSGRPAARPFSDGCIPSTLDPTLCPEGTHVMSLFTQWVPHTYADAPHTAELEAYADRVVAGYTSSPPTWPGLSSTAR